MKTILLSLISLIVLFASCSQDKIDKLTHQRDSLNTVAAEKDKAIADFMKAINEIQDNLQTIKEKEDLINKSTSGENQIPQDSLDRINEDILLIYDLLLTNKKTIQTLTQRLSYANVKIAGFDKMLNGLKAQITERDNEIQLLKGKLAAVNINIDNLNKVIQDLKLGIDTLNQSLATKQEVIEEKTSKLNMAWYVIGTKDELLKGGVIEKKGGFIGIGRTYRMKKSFNKSKFIEINVEQTKSIDLNCKKAELITTHPPTSFKINGKEPKITNLEVKDVDEFWGASKYLVVMIK